MRRIALTLGILTCGAGAVAVGMHANRPDEATARAGTRGEPALEADPDALRGPTLEACPAARRRAVTAAGEEGPPAPATELDRAADARAAADHADAAVRSHDESARTRKLTWYEQHREAVLARLAGIARDPREPERVRVLSLYLAAEVAPPGAHPTTAELLAEFLGSGVPELQRQSLRLLADALDRVEALEPALRLLADGTPNGNAVEAARILVRWGLVRAGEVEAWWDRWVASGDAEAQDAAVQPELLRGVESDAAVALLLRWIVELGPLGERIRFLDLGRDFVVVYPRVWALVAARDAHPRTRVRLLAATRARSDVTPETQLLATACLEGLKAEDLAQLVRLAESAGSDVHWALLGCFVAEQHPAPELVAAVLSRLSWREMNSWAQPWVRSLSEARLLEMQQTLGREALVQLFGQHREWIDDPAAKALVTPPPQAPDEG